MSTVPITASLCKSLFDRFDTLAENYLLDNANGFYCHLPNFEINFDCIDDNQMYTDY